MVITTTRLCLSRVPLSGRNLPFPSSSRFLPSTYLFRAATEHSIRAMSAYSSDKDVPFASHKEVLAACNTIEDSPAEFLNQFVADDVHWTVTSPSAKSTPIAGVYTSRQEFMEKALKPLSEHFAEPLKLRIVDVISSFPGPADTFSSDLVKVCLELEGTTKLKRDESEWKNYYSWVMHFKGKQAVTVRAYLDSASVNKAMEA